VDIIVSPCVSENQPLRTLRPPTLAITGVAGCLRILHSLHINFLAHRNGVALSSYDDFQRMGGIGKTILVIKNLPWQRNGAEAIYSHQFFDPIDVHIGKPARFPDLTHQADLVPPELVTHARPRLRQYLCGTLTMRLAPHAVPIPLKGPL